MWICKKNNLIDNRCYPQTFDSEVFEAKLKLCKIVRNETNQKKNSIFYKTYYDFYQTRLIGMLFFEITPFIFIPCACFIGLFFNWKIIQTIKQNEKKYLKEDFYKYMSANAKFNCLYCFIFVFYPMTSCNWRLSTSFCSSVFTTQFVQYFKIVIIAYFSEVLKMCANISYIMMTLNRYLLVGKDHAAWLVTIAKLEFKWVIRGSFLFSALINIGHGWEYQAVEYAVGLNGNEIQYLYVELNGFSHSDYPETNQGTPYFIYSMVYFSINFGVFLILNTTIEVNIVRRMQKELREKRERLAKMNSANSGLKTSSDGAENKSQTDLEDKKREREDGEKERKVIKMIVLNCFLNLILRGPDLLYCLQNLGVHENIFNIFKDYDNAKKEIVPGLLSFFTDLAYFTYLLTFTSNFVIFYVFNKNFNEAVVLFWIRKKK
jgi:hypothetical protein